MASTYVNDLRLNEMATGDQSGSWGTVTNTNLELIGEALGYGTQQVFGSDQDATTTVADGAADPARAMYFRVTSNGNLTANRTMTIAPNTVSRLMFIENATSGSQSITVKQGSDDAANKVIIPTGDTKAVYLDGAGGSGVVKDAFASLSVVDLKVQDDLTVTDDVAIGGTALVTGVLTTTAATVFNGGFASNAASTITTADNAAQLTLISTDADANAGPKLKLRRNSASPADDDLIGSLDWTSENSDGDEHDFLNLTARMRDVTAGSEDVAYAWTAYLGGTGREIQSFVNTDASAASMVFNEDSQDIDFRVESNGNTHMLFVDGGSDHVNIGTDTDYGGRLNIKTGDNTTNLVLVSTDADASVGPVLDLYRNSASPANNDFLGNITFRGRNNNSQDVQYAEQEVYTTDVTDGAEDGLVNYNVMTNGSNMSYLQLRAETATVVINEDSNDMDFRVESNNNANMLFVDGGNDKVLIGTNTPRTTFYDSNFGAQVQIEGLAATSNYLGMSIVTNSNDANGGFLALGSTRGTAVNATTVLQAGDALGALTFQGSDGSNMISGADIFAEVLSGVGANDMPTKLNFRTNSGTTAPVERMRVQHTAGNNVVIADGLTLTDGNLIIGGAGHGIDFSAQTPASGITPSAEILDHYEEGLFVVTGSLTSGTVTFNSSYNTMAYTRIGRQVTITGLIITSAVSSPSGVRIHIGSLPFTSSNLSEGAGASGGGLSWYDGTNINSRSWLIGEAQTNLAIYMDCTELTAGDDFYISATYFTDD